MRRTVKSNFDGPSAGSALIADQADPPWKVLADSVGSDIGSAVQSYPLNFRQLKEKDTRPNGPVANGYSTRYGGIIKLFARKSNFT